MKKILISFAIIIIFMLQLNVVSATSKSDDDGNANLDDKIYSNLSTDSVSCGLDEKTNKYLVSDIPKSIPKVVHIVYIVIQIAVPIIIVIFGMIDLVKSVIASKEDQIKKAQMTFVKRLIAGALVFFVFVIVKLLISLVGDGNNSSRIMNCASCFLNGTGNCVSK